MFVTNILEPLLLLYDFQLDLVSRPTVTVLDKMAIAIDWGGRMQENPTTSSFMATKLTGKTPIFGGSTGGLLSKADVEEKYAITWNSPKQQVFEMPTGGAATMVSGDNLLYLARKEQCLALGGQLRKFKITNYQVYRIMPKGDTTLLHPNDGVFPEKVNAGREAQNSVDRNIGSNPEPAKLKFTGKRTID